MSNFTYRTKFDYLKLGDRSDVHTTIRSDIYEEFQILAIRKNQPLTKYFDCAILMFLEDEDLKQKLIDKVKNYR